MPQRSRPGSNPGSPPSSALQWFPGQAGGPAAAVQGLFEALMDEPKMLPKYYASQLESRSKHRVIADYIASMSDRYAMSLYNEVFGLS